MERRGHDVVVAAELINGVDNTLLWSQRYIREITDLFALEGDIARQVARALRLQLTREEGESLTKRGTENPEAYQAFLRGQYCFNRAVVEGRPGFQRGIRSFEQAVQLDSSYQEAYEALADWSFYYARAVTASEQDYLHICWPSPAKPATFVPPARPNAWLLSWNG